jgi:hypothetical protein
LALKEEEKEMEKEKGMGKVLPISPPESVRLSPKRIKF